MVYHLRTNQEVVNERLHVHALDWAGRRSPGWLGPSIDFPDEERVSTSSAMVHLLVFMEGSYHLP